MSKQEFLDRLRKGLSGLPEYDIEERLTFYSEMIDDRMEEGVTEEAAVDEIGNVDDIVSQIVSEIPLSKLVKEKVKPKRSFRAWEIVLLILGFPIWFSLLIALFAIVFSFYIVIWSVIFSLWAVEVALGACFFTGIFSSFVFIFQGKALPGIGILGFGIFCAGLFILLFFGCKEASQGILLLTKKMALGIKSWFIGKEDVK